MTSDHMGDSFKNDQRELLRRLVPKPESRFSGHIQSLFQIVLTLTNKCPMTPVQLFEIHLFTKNI